MTEHKYILVMEDRKGKISVPLTDLSKAQKTVDRLNKILAPEDALTLKSIEPNNWVERE